MGLPVKFCKLVGLLLKHVLQHIKWLHSPLQHLLHCMVLQRRSPKACKCVAAISMILCLCNLHTPSAEYDSALEETVCRDDTYKRCQRMELCELVAEEMESVFYKPTLAHIADKLWQAELPLMSAALTKDAKKR